MNATVPPSARPAPVPSAMNRQALQLAMRVLDLAEVHARPHDMSQAHAQVARCLKAMDDYASAESYLGQALGWTAMIPGVDVQVDLLCELAEVTVAIAEAHDHNANRHAALERARDHAFKAARLADQTTDSHWEVKVLLRISDVFNRCGDHDEAAQMQERALTLLGLQPADPTTGELPTDGLPLPVPTLLM